MTEPFEPQTDNKENVFDVFREMSELPESSETMLQDVYFSDFKESSSRIFRIYKKLPLHYHEDCDEHLYVVSGEARYHLSGTEGLAKPGTFLRFSRKEVHGFQEILKHPFVILAIDVPRRRPDDIIFVNPEEGDAKAFMGRNG